MNMTTGRSRTRTGRMLGAVVSASFLALTACSGGEGVDVNGGEGNGEGEGAQGGTLVAAISAQPDQLDPHMTTAYPSFQVLENVYDTLVVPDASGEFQPSLATEWETSDDGLTWTFTLREGVTFHDGSEFDSADVVYSFNRIIDEELANAFRFASVESIEAPDPSTVVINVTEPTPYLLDTVGGFKGMSIVSENAAEEFDLVNEANGTGPFTLEDYSGSGVSLAAFDDYWGEEGPYLDGVEFQFVSEPTTALTSLQTGEVHWTDNIPPQQVEELQGGDAVEVETTPSVDYWYMALNHQVEPWDDVEARQAIAYAIDRESVVQAAKFGAASINQTAIPEQSIWYHEYAPFGYDPQQAQRLLDSAGVSDGQTLELMATTEYPETSATAQVIESNLEDVGIDVQISEPDFADWLRRQGEGDFDALLLGWLGNLDPFGFYEAQHRCEGANNAQGYCNPDVDQLLDQGRTETDQEQRKTFYDQAAEIIVDEVSYLYLYNPDVVHAWVPGLSGYETRPDRAINFETVQLAE